MGNITYFEKFSIVDGDVKINIDLTKYNTRLENAQKELDMQIMTDMEPFMPHDTGVFIQNTISASASVAGTGQVYAAYGVQGRYLYMGKVMVDSETGKGPALIHDKYGEPVGLRFRKGAKLTATSRPLQYRRATARPQWFEEAKKINCKKWIETAKRVLKDG